MDEKHAKNVSWAFEMSCYLKIGLLFLFFPLLWHLKIASTAPLNIASGIYTAELSLEPAEFQLLEATVFPSDAEQTGSTSQLLLYFE